MTVNYDGLGLADITYGWQFSKMYRLFPFFNIHELRREVWMWAPGERERGLGRAAVRGVDF